MVFEQFNTLFHHVYHSIVNTLKNIPIPLIDEQAKADYFKEIIHICSSDNSNNLEKLQYLVIYSPLSINFDVHHHDDILLKTACKYGNINIVDFLLTSPLLEQHADINSNKDEALMIAIDYLDKNMISYLLTSKNLKKHSNIHNNNDDIFKKISSKYYESSLPDYKNLLEYLIFEYNIK